MENSTMKTGNPVANEEDFQKVANKVSTITIIGNIALSLLKLFAGIVAHSNAMISDAIHSASDVFSTFVVISESDSHQKNRTKNIPMDMNAWSV